MERGHELGARSSEGLTLGQFLEAWLRDYGEMNLQATTLSQYRGVLRRDVIPYLGEIPLWDLGPEHIMDVIRRKARGGFAPSTVKRVHIVLRRALGHAVQWGYLERNPAAAIDGPPDRRGEGARVLAPEAVPSYLEVARRYRCYPILFTALYTGLRQGELLGLSWTDVEPEAIRVRRSLKRTAEGVLFLGSVKTPSARRTVPLSPANRGVLDAWRARTEEGNAARGPDDLVFATSGGTPVNPRNLLRDHHRILERAGLPRMPFHALRHTHATMLLRAGVHPKVVGERLGHSSIRVALDTYSHVLPSLQWELASRLDEMMGR